MEHAMDRRSFSQAAVAMALALAGQRTLAAPDVASKESAERHHLDVIEKYRHLWDGPKLEIGMLVYPGMFLQDLVGPLTMFEALMNRDIHLLWKNLQPVGPEKPEHPGLIPVPPNRTFAQCPEHLDVLFVPGGVPGTLTMMEDKEVLDFLADRGSKAKWVTSVCTGSLILGAAGLLKGYKATSYWATLDVLPTLGATPVRRRVVTDRNRVTGGGVTAGLDFGLDLIARLRSPDYAQAVQLYLEYDPAPRFQAGSPAKAPKEARQFMTQMFAGMNQAAHAAARRAMTNWPKQPG
jgi:cyclohexyl-isocyanide hydratase